MSFTLFHIHCKPWKTINAIEKELQSYRGFWVAHHMVQPFLEFRISTDFRFTTVYWIHLVWNIDYILWVCSTK